MDDLSAAPIPKNPAQHHPAYANILGMDTNLNVNKRQKILVLIGISLFWFLSTLVSVVIAPSGPVSVVILVLTSIGWGFGILLWCRIDANERGYELSSGEKIGIVLLGALALIWYLFHTRGAKGGFKSLGWLLLYVVTTFIVLTVIVTIILMILQITGVQELT